LNRGAGRYVYRGERITMVSAAAAAHSAPGATFWALPNPLLLIPALSAGVRLKAAPAAISYKVITVTKGRLDSSLMPLINRALTCGYAARP